MSSLSAIIITELGSKFFLTSHVNLMDMQIIRDVDDIQTNTTFNSENFTGKQGEEYTIWSVVF
jgi:hypothetical protein